MLASRFASRSPVLRSDSPLSDDQIHRVAPSIFAEAPHESRSQRYAYKLFLEHVPRVFAALQQARESVKAAANGSQGQLRIALSDGITPSRLPTLLAIYRQEELEVDTRLFQVPLSQQIKGFKITCTT